jgi:hypothetical protein
LYFERVEIALIYDIFDFVPFNHNSILINAS